MSENQRRTALGWIKAMSLSLVLVAVVSIGGCQPNGSLSSAPPSLSPVTPPITSTKIKEVSPPASIQELNRSFDQVQPQVKIISPVPDQLLTETSVAIKLQVKDFPLFQNGELEMGPHLHLILDNKPYQSIYGVEQLITLENLSPGTHSLRVFPVRPWHESFKNEGAFAQTTFHVLTKTAENTMEPTLPLLTYSRPKGSYGAEPILLDFYLTNAPLHVAAQADEKIPDWRIRVTINGESFLMDQWQPVYLQGFTPGKNWVKLEFIDEQGNLVVNGFNSTVRVIDYQPNGQDTLSKLVRGELSPEMMQALITPTAQSLVTPTLEPVKEDLPVTLEPSAKVSGEIPVEAGENDRETIISAPEAASLSVEIPSSPPSAELVTPKLPTEELAVESSLGEEESEARETISPENQDLEAQAS